MFFLFSLVLGAFLAVFLLQHVHLALIFFFRSTMLDFMRRLR